jgi:hypothetical protein
MPSITPDTGTAVSFLFWRGVVPTTRQRVTTWEVNGLNGVGVMVLGLGDSEGEGRAEYFAANNATAETFWQAVTQLQGKKCTLIDDFGNSHPNLVPTHVGQPIKKAMLAGNVLGVYVTIAMKFMTVV